MYCRHCGKENRNEASFCQFCGKKLQRNVGTNTTEKNFLKEKQTAVSSKETVDTENKPSKKKDLASKLSSYFDSGTLKKWWLWVIVALAIALIAETITIVHLNNQLKLAELTSVTQESDSDYSSEKETTEDEEAEDSEESDEKEDVDWLSKEYVVVSVYDKKTKKTTDIASGYGLQVETSEIRVSVEDELENEWAYIHLDENKEVKVKKYGTGNKYVNVSVNGSVAISGNNLCVEGSGHYLEVYTLMNQDEDSEMISIEDDDIVKIEVE